MLVRCLIAGPDEWADGAIGWLLEDPSRLRYGRGDRGAVYRPAWRLLRRYAALCSDNVLIRLLSMILMHRPKSERSAFRSRHEILMGESPIWGKPGYDILAYNDLGLGQYMLLSRASPGGDCRPR